MDINPEFSHIIHVSELRSGPLELDIVANAQELNALKDRFNVQDLSDFKGHIVLEKLENADVSVNGTFTAQIQQQCVVTLENVNSGVTGSFALIYSPDFIDKDDQEPEEEEEFEDINELSDTPEPLLDGKIDVGEALSQHLALEIDPFPRLKDAQFDGLVIGPKKDEEGAFEKKNPFQVLEKLKTK